MTRRDALADGVLMTKVLTGRYLAGFDDTNHTRQAEALPNHVAWSLGHCALTMHRAGEKIAGESPLPAAEFVEGAAGDASHFGAESVAFGSRPIADAKQYPSLARCVEIYNSACDRFAAVLRGCEESRLDETAKWGPGEVPLYALALRMIFHNGAHTGQIADLRRALGFKSIFA